MVSKNLVDAKAYENANEKFYDDYKKGTLNIYEFCAFTFNFLSQHSLEYLDQLHQEFMQEKIKPLMGDQAKTLVESHQQRGDELIIITATNSFITRPIAQAFGIEHLIATEAKIVNGKYTTEVSGTPCFQEGKVIRLNEWLKNNNKSMKNSSFYSDSHNDLPLLEIAETAIAVDPDEKLSEIAIQRGWKVISLK